MSDSIFHRGIIVVFAFPHEPSANATIYVAGGDSVAHAEHTSR